ncbi:molybdopterin synthase subunit MoaD [Stackebrandtia albiflava]|uniref:Molybdopterin synthase subunit MoaD n=1 Tax=Stackebrandtia albiflava TaxID=406432 RepID=A0A562UQV1_9ACTN|nr:MoaD/ThiS family protein [Stackebrandtia albiflava]TWJ07991.1 molybdopterin synthase subunit MoaD [Stackebrandtia albiflava]
MSVTVYIPGVLRNECDGASSVVLAEIAPTSLAQILDQLAVRYPRLDRRIRDEHGGLRRYVNVFVDADECRTLSGLATEVADGAQVRILPSVAGG